MKQFKTHNSRANHIACVLAWLAVGCQIVWLVYYHIWYIINGNTSYFEDYKFFNWWSLILGEYVYPIILVLLALFLSRYYKRPPKTICLAIIFCWLALDTIITGRYYDWSLFLSALFPNSRFFFSLSMYLDSIISLIISPLSILAIIEVLYGLKIKISSVIVPALYVISEFGFCLEMYFREDILEMYFRGDIDIDTIILATTSTFAAIFFHLALFVFVLHNRLPAVIRPKKKALSPEEALKELVVQHELGSISDEEFQSRREEIISKL